MPKKDQKQQNEQAKPAVDAPKVQQVQQVAVPLAPMQAAAKEFAANAIDNQNVGDCTTYLNQYAGRQKFRNKAGQLRTEATVSFGCIRDAAYPPKIGVDAESGYILLGEMDVVSRHNFGRTIFDRCVNYLRILGAKELFPRCTSLTQEFVVKIEEKDKVRVVTSIQFYGTFLVRKPFEIAKLKELRDWFFLDDTLPVSQRSIDFLFPVQQISVQGMMQVSEIVSIVEGIDQLNLTQYPGMVFICDGMNMSTQYIFEQKRKFYEKENSLELWVILARFINEHRSISRLDFLPKWLDNYVRYTNAKPLGKVFTNMCNCEKPLEMLRICLGMYPTAIQIDIAGAGQVVPKEVMEIAKTQMCSWYEQRIYQIGYLVDKFRIGAFNPDGIDMSCEGSVQGLMQLFAAYE